MPQIGFTSKQSPVYHRFNALRRAYEDATGGGRVYNPDFLTVLMDAWEKLDKVKVITFTPEMELSDFVKNVVRAAVDDIADAEANDPELQPKRKSLQDHIRERRALLQPVRIKDGSCRYMTTSTMAGANFFLTDDRNAAMVFDSPDKAKEFLRKCGHEVGNWILEPVNETK